MPESTSKPTKPPITNPLGLSSSSRPDPQDLNAIDFHELLQEHKDRTERSLPFTLQQVEDVVFVDHNYIVALEYIYYQDNGNYVELEETPERDERDNHPLATEYYKLSDKDAVRAFTDKPVNLRSKETPFLELHKNEFIRNETKNYNSEDSQEAEEKVKFVEALLALYHIMPNGQLELQSKQTIHYDCAFHPTKKNKMRLKLSSNASVVSLTTQGSVYSEDAGERQQFEATRRRDPYQSTPASTDSECDGRGHLTYSPFH